MLAGGLVEWVALCLMSETIKAGLTLFLLRLLLLLDETPENVNFVKGLIQLPKTKELKMII